MGEFPVPGMVPCDPVLMRARVWIEMPPDSGWGDIQLLATSLRGAGYVVEEQRGTGPVMLRLAGAKLERGALWRRPGQA